MSRSKLDDSPYVVIFMGLIAIAIPVLFAVCDLSETIEQNNIEDSAMADAVYVWASEHEYDIVSIASGGHDIAIVKYTTKANGANTVKLVKVGEKIQVVNDNHVRTFRPWEHTWMMNDE